MVVKRKQHRNPNLIRPRLAIEHSGFYPYLLRYEEALRIREFSERTLQRRNSNLRKFILWCDERGLEKPQDITKPILEGYQKHLYYYRQDNGEPLTVISRNQYLQDVKQWFKWLTQQNHLLYNPASELVMARRAPRLPAVLSSEDIAALMAQPNLNTPYGLRDRAILELLYSTGIRRTELVNLDLGDLSRVRQTIFVREGKGGKDRLLPIGKRALQWIERYLNEVRDHLMIDLHNEALFLNDYGERFGINSLGNRVKRHLRNAGIQVPGSCHLLRHAMATHMLENGAEMRYLQAMLGHADYRATQIYTHVAIHKLQEIHAATHPQERDQSDNE